MPDDLLTTVKAHFSDGEELGPFLTAQEARAAQERQVAEYRVWLRALLARCEAAEARATEHLNARNRYAAELDAARAEAARLREAAQALVDYQTTGAPGWPNWEDYVDALDRALAAKEDDA